MNVYQNKLKYKQYKLYTICKKRNKVYHNKNKSDILYWVKIMYELGGRVKWGLF